MLLCCAVMPDSLRPRGLQPTSVHGILQARKLGWLAMSYSRGIFLTQGSKPSLLGLLHWQMDSLSRSHLRRPSTHVYELLKMPTDITLLSISPFIFVNMCFMYSGAPKWVHICLKLLTLVVLLSLSLCNVLLCPVFVLKSILGNSLAV